MLENLTNEDIAKLIIRIDSSDGQADTIRLQDDLILGFYC